MFISELRQGNLGKELVTCFNRSGSMADLFMGAGAQLNSHFSGITLNVGPIGFNFDRFPT